MNTCPIIYRSIVYGTCFSCLVPHSILHHCPGNASCIYGKRMLRIIQHGYTGPLLPARGAGVAMGPAVLAYRAHVIACTSMTFTFNQMIVHVWSNYLQITSKYSYYLLSTILPTPLWHCWLR
jgi:hypothetical protein